MKMCLLFLTCRDDKEANKITNALLKKKLVFCVKKYSVKSSYLWKKKIEYVKEVMLIMDSVEGNFPVVEKVVASIHNYFT